jgi:hypothetical protein
MGLGMGAVISEIRLDTRQGVFARNTMQESMGEGRTKTIRRDGGFGIERCI